MSTNGLCGMLPMVVCSDSKSEKCQNVSLCHNAGFISCVCINSKLKLGLYKLSLGLYKLNLSLYKLRLSLQIVPMEDELPSGCRRKM